MKDPYQSLGVSKDASQEAIKNAYRSLAKKFHPDLNPGNKQAEAKFKDVAAAYEKIGDPEARGKFDRGETEEQMRGPGAGGPGSGPFYYQSQGGEGGRYSSNFGGGMGDDFFENLFRQSGGGGGGRRARQTDFPGEDQLYQMEVEFRDAALGAERDITLPGGKKLGIKIPAGVESGARLRFRGQGSPGVGKGAPGDAYVELTVKPLAGFIRRGKDIEVEVPVSFFEAGLGGEIQVPTIEGSVSLKVPAGVSSGSKLRVRGKGVGSAKGDRGDQIVTLKIVMPKVLPEELQKSMQEWQEKFSYNPREQR